MLFAKSKRFNTLVALGLVAWLLTACGNDNPTTTPAPTTSVATTAAATTNATTSVATTTSNAGAAATSAASTTTGSGTTAGVTASSAVSGTTASATTAAATTTSVVTGTTAATGNDPVSQLISTVPGLSPLSLSGSVASAVKTQLKAPQSVVTFYGSNDDTATLGDNLDKTITGGGYQFGIPGQSKPITSNGITIGLYNNSKNGGKDILFITTAIPASLGEVNDATASASVTSSGILGLTPQELQQSLSQLKGKKTLVLVVSGDNLLQNLTALGTGSAATTPASGANATPAPTPRPTA